MSKAKALPANAEKLVQASTRKPRRDTAVFDIGCIEMLRRDRISAVLKPNGAPKHIGLYCTDKPSKQITTVTTEDFNDRNMAGRLYVTKGAAASAKKGNRLTLRVAPIEEDLLYENVMAIALSRADPHTEYQVALYEPSRRNPTIHSCAQRARGAGVSRRHNDDHRATGGHRHKGHKALTPAALFTHNAGRFLDIGH